MNEFNLSEKVIIHSNEDMNDIVEFIQIQDVKEFIRLLKIELKDNNDRCDECIDYAFNKLAGDKLI